MGSRSRHRPLFFRLLRWIARLAVICVALLGLVSILPQQSPEHILPRMVAPMQLLDLAPTDRVLVLAPHPDDDVLACGGILQKAVALGLPVRVAFMTNGDGNEWSFITWSGKGPVLGDQAVRMGDVRHDEAVSGEAALGVDSDRLTFLGYPDLSTLDLFLSRWGDAPPLQSVLTRVSAVPYPYALRPHAPYTGDALLADVTRVIEEFKPTRIFVSHPADRNRDHRALYLFTRVALWHLPAVEAKLHPFLVHVPGWPHPSGLHEEQDLVPPLWFRDRIDWMRWRLSRHEVATKSSALGSHQTQFSYSAPYLQSFVRKDELFGDLAPVDLRAGRPEADPDQMISDETAPLVGEEWRYARLKDGRLELSIVYARPVARQTRATFCLYGDRDDRPFSGMPKLSVAVDPFHVVVRDRGTRIAQGGVRVVRVARGTTVSVPLEMLGHPRHVLVAAESFLGEVALDFGWWVDVEVR